MITKITLTIRGNLHELTPDCVKNWDEVLCTYKRSDYSGIVRSFTSKFDFVGEAYDALLAEYLNHRYDGIAKVAVWTIGNDWTFTKQFECPLDFSTVQLENGVMSISAIDSSAAAAIKANKSTKYELTIGTDIVSDGLFHFDRIPMVESVTYAFTDGENKDNSAALRVTLNSSDGNVIWLGSIADEISLGGHIYWKDDQETEEDSYMIMAYKSLAVNLKSEIVLDATFGSGTAQNVVIQQLSSGGTVKDTAQLCTIGNKELTDVGTYANLGQLQSAYPEEDGVAANSGKLFATIGGIVWAYVYNGTKTIWQSSGKSKSEYAPLRRVYSLDKDFAMSKGDIIRAVVFWDSGATATSRVLSSSIRFSWTARGKACDIPAFLPATVLEAVLTKVLAGKYNPVCRISDHDSRMANTVLMAAESIRDIGGAKFYSSFNDFADWIETVFGYTYYLGESWSSGLTAVTRNFGGIIDADTPQTVGAPPGDFEDDDIKYNLALGRFVLCKDGYWHTWNGCIYYNKLDNSGPSTSRLFFDGTTYYYFTEGDSTPKAYRGALSDKGKPFQEIIFVHRSELFDPSASVKEIAGATELRYSVDASSIYSTVEIGYDEHDYDSVNGRDEFNFSHTYSTGCSVSTKKLSLISKYRADSYGIEFAAQKRGEETTDTDSDSDVFFAHVSVSGRDYTPDRSAAIEGALNDAVFNAAFSPIHCVRANAGYIGMQSDALTLKFASSDGNSAIVIDGEPVTSNLVLDTPLLTPGNVEFTTSDLELPEMGSLISVEKNGLRYTGFISEAEERFAHEEAVKYKILVKTIEQC